MTDAPQLKAAVEQAMAALQAGRFDEAVRFADAVLAISIGHYEASQVKALALLHSGRGAEALPYAEQLARQFPSDAFSHNTRAAVLEILGRLDEAAASYRRATTLAPQYADSWLNLGRACAQLGNHAEAATAFDKAIRAGVQHPRARLFWNTSSAWASLQASDFDAAVGFARAALEIAPEFPDGLAAAAPAELQAGDLSRALDHYARLEAATPNRAGWRFLRAIAWPPVMESREAIAQRLAEVERALDEIIAEPLPIADPFRQVATTGFYMAYQGFDDTLLQRKLARAYAAACPALAWTAPHVGKPRQRSKRIRLGILSQYLRNHTIGKLNIGIARELDRERFELIVLRPPCAADTLSSAFDEVASRVITLPLDLDQARRAIAEAQLDALFYPDIGMDPFTYYLAFARLARLQFTTWGHPVTTGIDNMDCYVSTRHAEPEGAQRFYSEKLVQLESLPSFYLPPREPSAFDVRAKLGLAAGERLYACPQTLYKFHPDFDGVLLEIARRDPGARIVLIAAATRAWNARLRRRLELADGEAARRVTFLPALPLPDYLALLRDADALLDPFHFGGGSSSYEALSLGSPIVTLPAEMMRGRITAAWYGAMGVSRWTAKSPQHFVELALELAQGEKRAAWRAEIREGAAKLLGNVAVVREIEAFVESALDA